jgi:hypothetical protein
VALFGELSYCVSHQTTCCPRQHAYRQEEGDGTAKPHACLLFPASSIDRALFV